MNIEDYDEDQALYDLEQSLFGNIVHFECFCMSCGEYVTDAEPDADWVGGGDNIKCPDCGPGTRIQSGLIAKGLM